MTRQITHPPLAPVELRCNLQKGPLAVVARKPEFSWRHQEGTLRQSAYQVQVAQDPGGFDTGRDGIVWDSGKVLSDQCLHVPYGGRPLEPGVRYHWRVRTWNEAGLASPFSEPASFVTALWDGWRASWIWERERLPENHHVLFRKEFPSPEKAVESVLAFVSADDYYKLFVNGSLVGQGPAPGYPDIEYHYNVIDLTQAWNRGGPVCLAAHAYYQGLKNYVWVSGDDRRGFILELHIHYEDGTVEVAGTDETWRVKRADAYQSSHVIGAQTAFNENIDARRLPVGWNEPGYDDTAWEPAHVVESPDWKLHAQETGMLTVYPVVPAEVVQKGPGHYFVDFGREVVGTLRVAFDAEGSERVEIRLGEELSGPRTVRHEMRCNCLYQDFWTLRPGKQEIEHYDYRGFRYGEIIGAPSPLNVTSIRAIVRHYPCDEGASHFECSDRELNALWKLTKYSTMMGTQEVYMDCPTREKANYSLDTYLEMSAAFYQLGEAKLGGRMIELLLQSDPDGKLRCLGPAGRDHFFTEYTMYPILMAARYYDFTGDRAFIVRNYEAMTRVEQYFRRTFARPDGLLQGTDEILRDLVDWPKNRRDGHVFMPVNTVVNAVYYRMVLELGRFAEIVGDSGRAGRYRTLAESLHRAVNEQLWDPDGKRYVDGLDEDNRAAEHASLHSNAFVLAMGLVPEERVPDVLAYIKTRGLNCNTFLAMFLFEALYDHGAADYAFELLTAAGDNSPLHMVRQGATTTWEAWALEQKWNTSLFHPATAFTGYIIASRIMGITPLEPGFKKVRIRPQLGPLEHASIRVSTLFGPVRLKVSRSRESVALETDVPPNTSAELWVPRTGVEYGTLIVDGEMVSGRPSGDWLLLDDVTPGTHTVLLKRANERLGDEEIPTAAQNR